MDYKIVGSFVVQDETTAAIEEALSVIKGWNPNWNPETFMTDNCEEEIQATERNFEGNDNLTQLYVIVSFPASKKKKRKQACSLLFFISVTRHGFSTTV